MKLRTFQEIREITGMIREITENFGKSLTIRLVQPNALLQVFVITVHFLSWAKTSLFIGIPETVSHSLQKKKQEISQKIKKT